MEVKSPGKSAVLGDLKGGELVWAGERNAVVVKHEASGGFQPSRDVVDVATGERIGLPHTERVTVYDKAKIVLE